MPISSLTSLIDAFLLQQCADLDAPLLEVCRYALRGGHRTRGRLLLLAAGHAKRSAVRAAAAVEMLHAATLLQDDIFDASLQRRGKTAAHVQFGKAHSILASDWLLVRSLELAGEVHPAFFRSLAGAARRMAQTVAAELLPPMLPDAATARDHINTVAEGKTAVLFASALHGAALLHRGPTVHPARWADVGCHIGHVHQQVDDCMDVYGTLDTTGKEVGQDLSAGRLTTPLLLAFEILRERGSAISLAALQRGQLSPGEITALRHTLQTGQLRESLFGDIWDQVQVACQSAEAAAIPAETMRYWAEDVRRKLDACFGAPLVRSSNPCEVAPLPGSLMQEALRTAHP